MESRIIEPDFSDMTEYTSCVLCPRNCRIDRTKAKGYCNEGDTLHISRAALHMWEEPCISGSKGSGTVFFSGCNMRCIFCQNREISRGEVGKYISQERLVEIFFELQEKGANNINLVTADMFIPSVKRVIEKSKQQGIKIPFFLNTSSYINAETIKSLEGLIDIYLPDFKYIRDEDAIRYSNAPAYAETAKAAIDEMVRQQPSCSFYDDENGQHLIKNGVIVRHLLLPGKLIQAKMTVKYLYEKYDDNIYISLMNQFTPNGMLQNYPEINRKITGAEYHSLIKYAQHLGITNAYIQVGETATESFIPRFDCTGV